MSSDEYLYNKGDIKTLHIQSIESKNNITIKNHMMTSDEDVKIVEGDLKQAIFSILDLRVTVRNTLRNVLHPGNYNKICRITFLPA